jgi:hypothetical protein
MIEPVLKPIVQSAPRSLPRARGSEATLLARAAVAPSKPSARDFCSGAILVQNLLLMPFTVNIDFARQLMTERQIG